MYFITPRDISPDSALLWIAAVDKPGAAARLKLVPETLGAHLPQPWERWPLDGGTPRIEHREVRVSGLTPRQTYTFALEADGARVAEARVTTLPAKLPLLGEKPFTVLLGSCFSRREDEEGKVGNSFFHLPHSARPDVKILAGDQVYLDSPFSRFLKRTHTRTELRALFTEHYTSTWSQTKGFARMLSDGANYFSSDDHEFWNNAPNKATLIQDSWSEAGKKVWLGVARELYTIFQTKNVLNTFIVSPVSFFIADTRINRDAEEKNFMRPGDLQQVNSWIKGLAGPGVLVIGQPLLQGGSGFFSGHFADWNLPDYEQYHELAGIVGRSEHSLIILTGDVHYGRVARSSLRSGHELIEIISSPMSLVDAKVKGKWEKAPQVFPAVRPSATTPSSLAPAGVVTEADFSPNESHFVTLEFTRRGVGAHVCLRYWPIFGGGTPPPDFGRKVWERVVT